ncbi:hypothetical protein BJ875DRAFT_451749 [Amylocarpus encephaloides]|uniref:Cellobiose dehydrogenase-like cytochrome domain-containing protein n=1 Tax=Amylocarpus encephaloides TaxID=45428 RepID=A0A9P7YS65_9HELO|nr:hypothetical protein BJ875DRAFT_451749 [Amylocarpus encephaloides]
MHWSFGAACVAALLVPLSGAQQVPSTSYRDYETGFTFASFDAAYKIGRNFQIRVAVPTSATAGSDYDVVVQIVAPNELGWVGLCWGGTMLMNPLSVGWASGNTAVMASRWASSRDNPSVYTGATLQPMRIGTKVNGSHWQVTAKCTGCTTWISNNRANAIDPVGTSVRLASAAGPGRPNGVSPSAALPTHTVHPYLIGNFNHAQNPSFEDLVARNS